MTGLDVFGECEVAGLDEPERGVETAEPTVALRGVEGLLAGRERLALGEGGGTARLKERILTGESAGAGECLAGSWGESLLGGEGGGGDIRGGFGHSHSRYRYLANGSGSSSSP